MKKPKYPLVSTSSFRIAVGYSLAFTCVAGLFLWIVYTTVSGLVDAGTNNLIEAEVQGLREQYMQLSLEDFIGLIRERSEQQDVRGAVYLLVDPNGVALAGNIPTWPEAETRSGQWVKFTLTVAFGEDTREHLIRAREFVLPRGLRMIVGHDVQERHDLKQLMLRGLALAVFPTILLGVGGGIFMGRRILREVRGLSAASQQIMSGDLSQRLPVSNANDELNTLAREINAMLEKIEQLTLGMRTVLDSAAHDLRTPLNRLQRAAEAGSLVQVDAEIQAMRTTLDALMRIALAETGTVARENVDLSELIASVAELYTPVAEEGALRLTSTVEPNIGLQGSRQLLAQAVSNLLDNCIKYVPAGGRIEMSLSARAGAVELRVADNGPGIPVAQRAAAMRRRARLDTARDVPGSGLGLALVAAVAKLHGGSVELDDANPGLVVCVRFPAPES